MPLWHIIVFLVNVVIRDGSEEALGECSARLCNMHADAASFQAGLE